MEITGMDMPALVSLRLPAAFEGVVRRVDRLRARNSPCLAKILHIEARVSRGNL